MDELFTNLLLYNYQGKNYLVFRRITSYTILYRREIIEQAQDIQKNRLKHSGVSAESLYKGNVIDEEKSTQEVKRNLLFT